MSKINIVINAILVLDVDVMAAVNFSLLALLKRFNFHHFLCTVLEVNIGHFIVNKIVSDVANTQA